MLLPGPEAQQLATYVGWRRADWRGALVSGWLFVLPGVLVMYALCWAYVGLSHLPDVAVAFLGIKCAVIAILAQALIRLARRALRFSGAIVVAIAAFVSIYCFSVSYPLIILASGLMGYLFTGTPVENSSEVTRPGSPNERLSLGLVVSTFLAWVAPTAMVFLCLGPDHVLTRVAVFFSEVAVVTFGGAYAVLGYVADHAVREGWLTVAQMTDGLGLAETTPGPLILVLQFIAFLAGQGQASGSSTWLMATAASALAVWTLFVPSFLWVFLGAPFLDRLNANPRLQRALSYITASVMGVILNFSVWFTLHVAFAKVGQIQAGPLVLVVVEPHSFQWMVVLPVAVAFCCLFALRQSVLVTLAAAAGASLLASWV
jgi:chromate transporter